MKCHIDVFATLMIATTAAQAEQAVQQTVTITAKRDAEWHSYRHAARPLPLTEGYPFENATMGNYKLAVYRFSDWPQDGEVRALDQPLAIGTLYD